MKLLIIQPYLTKYRVPIFKELNEYYDVSVVASVDGSFGNISKEELTVLKFRHLKERRFLSGRFIWQAGVLSALFKVRPKVVFMSANPRYLSLWLSLVVAKLFGMKVLLHGQGLYNKASPSIIHKIQYVLFSFFCEKYICYTDSCKESLSRTKIRNKAVVADNSIDNKYPVEKITKYESGILFIGRLRDGCKLNLLIKATNQLVYEGFPITLHIVGGGGELLKMQKKWVDYSHIKFYGEVYDSKKISEISKLCFTGCYPGDAGLSVLHYMSLSLPPIVHSSMDKHMGPEPSYINNGDNGLLFEKDSLRSLTDIIESLMGNNKALNDMQSSAFKTYQRITTPSLGLRIKKIVENVVRGENENS
ncbi:MAG: glycosyltransferase [Colwellia sp.]